LLGIVLVIVAHRGQIAAAGMMAGLGILLQSVGMEPVKYTMRFTFGQDWLTSGLDLIVVVLGLFAISQAFSLLVDPESAPDAARSKAAWAKRCLACSNTNVWRPRGHFLAWSWA
jgi:putative tricarboxylic transport membrane protein